MTGGSIRVAVVTGASSGIGKQIAIALARDGFRVIGTGRDSGRMASAEREIRAASTSGEVDMIEADLSLLGEAEATARRIAALTDRVDLLFNNAGGMPSEKVITSEGLEANFAGNHLGPFLLTERLMPLLRAATRGAPTGSVRILNTASNASEMIDTINLDDLQNLDAFTPGLAYCSSKLGNVLHARGLAERHGEEGIVAHAVHPGVVDSNFFANAGPDTQERIRHLDKVSEAEGADTLLWLATSEDGGRSNGGYWSDRAPRTPNPLVEDATVRERFWSESETLVDGVLSKQASPAQ